MDSVGTMCDRASEAIKQCTITKLQRQSNQLPYGSPNDIEDEIQRQATRCCYTIDILISSSTDQMVTADRFLDEDVRFYLHICYPTCQGIHVLIDCLQLLDDDSTVGDASSPETTLRRLNHEDHMFQLRRIQYPILKLVQKLEKQAHRDHHPVPNLWRSQIRHRLDRWVDDIVMFSSGSERTLDRFKSQTWLLKLANYATISLFPNPHLAVRSGDARHLVTAACQVLVTFRRFRVREHLSCYTWTAVSFILHNVRNTKVHTDIMHQVDSPISSRRHHAILLVGNANPSAALSVRSSFRMPSPLCLFRYAGGLRQQMGVSTRLPKRL